MERAAGAGKRGQKAQKAGTSDRRLVLDRWELQSLGQEEKLTGKDVKDYLC